MKRLPAILALVILSAIVWSCSSGGVIGKEKMARILADLSIADGVVETDRHSYLTDSSKIVLRESIYAKHGVTTEQVDSSLKWYGYHMDKYVEVYDLAIGMVEKDIQTTTANAGTMRESNRSTSIYATEGDSVDLWPGQRLRLFTANMPGDFATFHLVSDRNWENGDVYTISARLSGSTSTPLRMAITAEYPDGSRDYVVGDAAGEGWQHVDLPLDPERKASIVFGYITAAPRGKEVLIADSISLVRRRVGAVPAGSAGVKHTSPLYGR